MTHSEKVTMTCEMVGSEIQTVALWWRRLGSVRCVQSPAVVLTPQVGAVYTAMGAETIGSHQSSQVSGFVVQITLGSMMQE